MKSTTPTFRRAVLARVRTPAAALMLLLPSAFMLTALPATALAQPALPEVRSLDVRTDSDLGPGSRLSFRAVGTPRAQVQVRVAGVRDRIALREVSRGVYVGRYTIKRGEAVREDRDVRVSLRVGNRTASAEYALAEVMSDRPVATAPPPPVAVPPAPPLRIERFGAAPIDRLEPGAELRFALEGPPGATVMVDLPGVADDVALREVRPGHYEGSYTLRRADNLHPSRPVVATLRLGDRTATATLSGPLVQARAENRPPQVVPVNLPLQVLNHGNNGSVEGGPTVVQGRTAAFATVEAKVDASAPVPGGFSVGQHIYSQTLQADANGNFSFSFVPRFPIPGSRYEIALLASKAGATNETKLVLHQR